MTSFRSKPVGWRGESHRHYLAAKGIKTVKVYHGTHPSNRENILKTGLLPSKYGKGVFVTTNPLLAVQFAAREEHDSSKYVRDVTIPEQAEVDIFVAEVPVEDLDWVNARGKKIRNVSSVDDVKSEYSKFDIEYENGEPSSLRRAEFLRVRKAIPVSALKLPREQLIRKRVRDAEISEHNIIEGAKR